MEEAQGMMKLVEQLKEERELLSSTPSVSPSLQPPNPGPDVRGQRPRLSPHQAFWLFFCRKCVLSTVYRGWCNAELFCLVFLLLIFTSVYGINLEVNCTQCSSNIFGNVSSNPSNAK